MCALQGLELPVGTTGCELEEPVSQWIRKGIK